MNSITGSSLAALFYRYDHRWKPSSSLFEASRKLGTNQLQTADSAPYMRKPRYAGDLREQATRVFPGYCAA